MDASFIPIEVVPSKTPFGLDQLRRSYKTSLSAEVAISVCPPVGTADETFQFMFLMPINTPESAESATRVDLVYMGCIAEADDLPLLPDSKLDDDDTVMSASSSKSSLGNLMNSPMTVQYYGPESVYSWWTYLAKGVKGTAPDPDRDIEIITLTIGDTSFTPGTSNIPYLVSIFFTEQIIDTIQSTEIVPGKFWQNNERKIKNLTAFILSVEPGFYPVMFSGGHDYEIGDVISITSGGVCTMTIQGVGTIGDIYFIDVTSNALSAAEETPIAATGGSGAGATFTVVEVT